MVKTCDLCGRQFEKQGQLNLHKRNCMLKKFKEQQAATVEECSHSWRLLQSIGIEKQAIVRGFTELCTKCQEVK